MAFVALLDASVLVPGSLSDTLLRAAESYLYRLTWSDEILAEVERSLISSLGVDPDKARRRVDAMRLAFPEAAVESYQTLEPSIPGVHPDDRHVAAAAVKAGAQVIVTSNLRHFPQSALDPYDIEAQSLDEFLQHLFHLASERMVQIIVEQAVALRSPPRSPLEVCEHLRPFAPGFVQLVEKDLSGR